MKQERKNYIIENYMSSESYGVIHETEIPSLASKLDVKETTIKKDLKELNCIIYKKKPAKLKELETYKPVLDELKLKFGTRMPKYLQNRSVRQLVGQNLWSKVRSIVLEQENTCCSVCRYTTDELKRLHVHEEWEVDTENLIIKLTGLSLLCINCHSLQHFENVYFRTAEKGKWEEVRYKLHLHFMKVNECTQDILLASKRLSGEERRDITTTGSKNQIEHIEKIEFLNKATWSYSIYEGMPLREEIIEALQKKVNVL